MEDGGDRCPRFGLLAAVLLVLASAGLAGCAESGQQAAQAAAQVAGCQDHSGAQNEAGYFQYGGAVACKDGTETFDWTNRQPQADVQFGSGVIEGELTIEIRDAMDRTVFQETVSGDSEGKQTTTDSGFPSAPILGDWTIEITFDNVTGSLGVQVFSSQQG